MPDRATRQFFKICDHGQKFTTVNKIMCQLYIRGADNYPYRGRVTDTFFSAKKKLPCFFDAKCFWAEKGLTVPGLNIPTRTQKRELPHENLDKK
jgi:hypothetical protein